MKKIVFVIPYEEMREQILTVWNLHGDFYKGIPCIDNSEYDIFFEQIFHSEDILKRKYDVDTIVARGATALGLKTRNGDIPIVEMTISALDMERAVKMAKKRYGDLKMAVVGSKNMVYAAAIILNREKYDLGIYEYSMNDEENITKAVFNAVNDGFDVIITGKLSCKYCEKYNIKHQNINTSVSSIWQAITEAKRAATIFYNERHRAMKFKTVVDYAHEGIITFDINKNIEIINDKARELLGIGKEEITGKNIETVIPGTEICSYINSDKEYDNELVDAFTNKINLNKVNLILEKKFIGSVVTFQDMTSILEAEVRIRKKLSKKGHIAKYNFSNIIGSSAKIRDTINQASIYAKTESNIMLYGETGTGKEVFAQAIHNNSERKKGPFVAVNCAALAENLLESELFGYVDGAFTGASKGGKQGVFEMAHRGTLFLDEIGEIPLYLQGKLLRVIQEKEVMKLGDDKITPVDVRIICATNRNLRELVKKGDFREDLYFRLNVLCVYIPPLRERDGDAVEILEYFLNEYDVKSEKSKLYLNDDAKKLILSYDWSGNIRELRNISERLMVLNNNGGIIGYKELKNVLPDFETDNTELEVLNVNQNKNYYESIKGLERERILEALKKCGFNKTKTAEYLNMSRATLWKKIKELDINN